MANCKQFLATFGGTQNVELENTKMGSSGAGLKQTYTTSISNEHYTRILLLLAQEFLTAKRNDHAKKRTDSLISTAGMENKAKKTTNNICTR